MDRINKRGKTRTIKYLLSRRIKYRSGNTTLREKMGKQNNSRKPST